jgi:hypothetical protein
MKYVELRNELCILFRQAVEKAGEESPEFRELVVYVSQDCAGILVIFAIDTLR